MDDAKEEWDRIATELNRIGLLTVVDRTALAGYCQSYAQWKDAVAWIKKHGQVYPLKDDKGNVKCLQQFPQVGIANQCLKQIRAFCGLFGLDPSSRARLELPSEDEADDFKSKLRAKMG